MGEPQGGKEQKRLSGAYFVPSQPAAQACLSARQPGKQPPTSSGCLSVFNPLQPASPLTLLIHFAHPPGPRCG